MPSQEIITRRCLPHWYVPGAAHFVTYRLHDSLPPQALADIKARKEQLLRNHPLADLPEPERQRIHKLLFARYDYWLDSREDVAWLNDPRLGAVIRSNLYHHHAKKYYLYAYCVMPTHVHVLFQPIEPFSPTSSADVGECSDQGSPLSSIMHSLKSYTAHEANRILNRRGAFWQSESYDHWVRDEQELERIVDYIANNPVKANRVKRPHHAFFSSCQDRYLTDGEVSGWLLWNR
jgi:putative DNA methylase